MRKFKLNKSWLRKNLPILIACAGLIGFQPTTFAQEEVIYGGGDEETMEQTVDNKTIIEAGDVISGGDVIGGISAAGLVDQNTVEINGGSINGAAGGLSVVNLDFNNIAGDVTNNRIVIRGGTLNYVSGGEIGYSYPIVSSVDTSIFATLGRGNVERNSVSIEGGTVNGSVVGGAALSGSARNNSVTISGGTIRGQVIGGLVRYPTEESVIENNSITITLSDSERNRTSIDLSDVDLIGGMFVGSGGNLNHILNNSLTIDKVSGLNVHSVDGFDTMTFNLPTTGDTILNVTGGSPTTLNGTTIIVTADGNNARATTDLTLNLIRNDSGIEGSNIQLPNTFMKGVSLEYELELLDDDGNVIARNLGDNAAISSAIDGDGNFSTTGFHARVGEQIDGIKPPTGEFVVVGGEVLPNEVIDVIDRNNDNWKPHEDEFREIQDEDEDSDNEMKIFAGVHGSSLRTKLSDGGHINNQTLGFGLGGSKTLVSKRNGSHFSFAPIIDHGKGKFDTYTADGRHGTGDTQFSALGVIGRRMLNNGFYYEASLRYGRAKSNFSSNDFPAKRNVSSDGFESNVEGSTYASYDMSAPIIAGHINIGKLFAINRENTVHVYGQYLHAHQGSMAADLSSGEHYVFDSVNEGTFIAGIRFINQPNKVNKFYSGFAYQYDHSSGSSAHYDGQSTHEVDSNGGTGIFELGWELKPHAAIPWVIDLGATGYIGQQKGLSFKAKVKKSF